MASPSEYIGIIDQNKEFLNPHTQLLQSLLLSKLNASDNSYTETTDGNADGSQYPSEGVSESSDK